MSKISFQPIGKIYTGFKDPKQSHIICHQGIKANNPAKIKIYKKYQAGLDKLSEYSHIFVLYFLSKVTKAELKTHPGPPKLKGLPEVGVFASRSQYRPNPIALRLAKLNKIKDNILYVEGMDGIDGSPVLDIKPYVLIFDRPDKYRVSQWYQWF